MSIAIFFLLALVAAGVVVYPLLPGRTVGQAAPVVVDGDIEQAVRKLRRARSQRGKVCPSCGGAYREGDRFCVRCGGAFPDPAAALTEPACPSCGAAVRLTDQFCAKCGHRVAAASSPEEAV